MADIVAVTGTDSAADTLTTEGTGTPTATENEIVETAEVISTMDSDSAEETRSPEELRSADGTRSAEEDVRELAANLPKDMTEARLIQLIAQAVQKAGKDAILPGADSAQGQKSAVVEPNEKPAEETDDKSTEKSTEKSIERSTEKSTENKMTNDNVTLNRGEDGGAQVQEIPLENLHPFKNHPYHVPERMDEEIRRLVESIEMIGLATPAIARKLPGGPDGEYELISGHRRKKACELLGRTTMPVIVKEYKDDDEATFAMLDSNIQREGVKPSERAKSLKLKYKTMMHRGKKGEGEGQVTLKVIGESEGLNWKAVQRYINLAGLSDDLLDLLDTKALKFYSAVELSYLPKESQETVYDYLSSHPGVKLTIEQAKKLKAISRDEEVTPETMEEVLSVQEVKSSGGKHFQLSYDELRRKYFDKDTTDKEIEETIYWLLDDWEASTKRSLPGEK